MAHCTRSFLFLLVFAAAQHALAIEPVRASVQATAGARTLYAPCASCEDCHQKIYIQHLGSMHSHSFSNPVFQAQYQADILPHAYSGVEGFRAARSCTSCHAPVAHRQGRAKVVTLEQYPNGNASVTCDFCHTITGFRGTEAGDGNYITAPGETKFGPFREQGDWHHQYSPLQTKSEFCAICHSATSQLGLGIKSTYAEWKESRHAKQGIECQDCHMSVNGFLDNGRPVHDAGVAASMNLASSPARPEIFTHRFQGARTQSQIDGAIRLTFRNPTAAAPGEDFKATLLVDNSRTGHKMPSGSVELRYLWLDLYAEIDGRRINLEPLESPDCTGYGRTGAHRELDQTMLGDAVPNGRRIYRTLLSDANGQPTLAFYRAKNVISDNRLNASELREETFAFKLPPAAPASFKLVAAMYYVAYPDAFAEQFGLPKAAHVRIASTTAEVPVRPAPLQPL